MATPVKAPVVPELPADFGGAYHEDPPPAAVEAGRRALECLARLARGGLAPQEHAATMWMLFKSFEVEAGAMADAVVAETGLTAKQLLAVLLDRARRAQLVDAHGVYWRRAIEDEYRELS